MQEEIFKQVWSFINVENDSEIFFNALEKTLKTKKILRTEEQSLFIFQPKPNKSHKFRIIIETINLNEKLVKYLTELILKEFVRSAQIPTMNGLEEGIYKEKQEGWIYDSQFSFL